MTPEEANLIKELFNRLYTLENAPRDREAETLIQEGLQYAPNAPYALVQTVLVQDEALKRANARIQELEGGAGGGDTPRDTSFLGGVRDSLFGKRDSRGSVPSVPPAGAGGGTSSAWQHTGTPPPPSGGPFGAPAGSYAAPPGSPAGPYAAPPGMPPPGGGGGSFLGTAAAAAAGAIGGSLLLGSIRSMMGGGHGGSAHAAYNPQAGGGSPWGGGGSAAGGELSRQAGLDDIGRGPSSSQSSDRGSGLLGDGSSDDRTAGDDQPAEDDSDLDLGGDDGDFDGGGGGDDE
jgi:uncharacterized protein